MLDGSANVAALWDRWRARRDDRTRASLIEAYVPLVHACVHQMGIVGTAILSHEDLVGAGMLGLVAAVDRFDASRGIKFETFAAFRIRGAVLDAARSLDPLSRAARRGVTQLRARTHLMEQELGRPISLDEAAVALGQHGMLRDRGVAACIQIEVSLSTSCGPPDDEGDVTLEDTLPDRDLPPPDSLVETRELHRALAEGVALLPERERAIIEQHYSQDVSLRELGKRMAVSQSRIYQIHTRAIGRLRSHLESGLATQHSLATA